MAFLKISWQLRIVQGFGGSVSGEEAEFETDGGVGRGRNILRRNSGKRECFDIAVVEEEVSEDGAPIMTGTLALRIFLYALSSFDYTLGSYFFLNMFSI